MLAIAQILGIGVTLGGIITFLVNIFVLRLFLSKGLVNVKHDCVIVYRLIFNFIVCDTIQVTPTIYIGICAVLQNGLLPAELEVIPGTVNLWMWYQMMFMLITMAINRYIGICHWNKYATIFTARTSVVIIVGSWIVSGTYAMVDQFVIPCCAMITYYPIFTFLYRNPDGQENLVSKYNPPTGQICIGVLVFCYGKIIYSLRKSAQQVKQTTSTNHQLNRTRRNTRLAIQFVFISIFFVLMFLFYSYFPKLFHSGVLLPYSAIAFCMVAHCSINSIMCLAFNPEIRRLAQQMLYCGWDALDNNETQLFQRTRTNIIARY